MNQYTPRQHTAEDQRNDLHLLLHQCRPHMLDRYTVDELLRTHRKLDAKEVEYRLTIARQNRAGEPR